MRSTSGDRPSSWLVPLTIAVVLAGCASPVPTASPALTATPPSTATPTGTPTPTAPSTPAAVISTPTPLLMASPTPVPTEVVTPKATEKPTPEPSESPSPPPTPVPTPTPRPTAGLGLAISTVARAKADPAAAKTAAASINAFGLDLFRQMLADPKLDLAQKNAVFSPTSIALALGMARAGAKGETAAQMDAVLHTSGWGALGPGLNSLDQALASRDATWKDDAGTEHALALHIASAAYGQQGWTIEQPYLDAIARAFGAGLRLVDFIAHPAAAIKAINAWVSDQTAKRIPQLLLPADVTPLTRLFLVDAMYLKANWEQEFDPSDTKSAPFIRLDGSRVTVPMMSTVGGGGINARPIPYAHGSGWQAVELRYEGGVGYYKGGARYDNAPLAMTLVLPDDLAAFEKGLTASQLERITTALASQRRAFTDGVPCPGLGGCYPYDLHLYLPRFSIETRADLPPVLAALGMPLAFDMDRADFTGIHVPEMDTDRLYIFKVVHEANIDVDEKGTEAAAATAVGMATGGGPSPLKEITLRFDHPFLFFVRDLDTGAVLFMGQVTDPSDGKGT